MDAAQALADLTEISSQIEGAVLAAADGRVLASTFPDEEKGDRVTRAALELLHAAEETRAEGGPDLSQVLAATPGGAVFLVRDEDRLIAAVTGRDPTVGLVFYDLKTCLRLVGDQDGEKRKAGAEKAAPKRAKATAKKNGA